MKTLKYAQIISVLLLSIFLFTGCSSKSNDNEQSFDEKIWQTYSDNNRLDKYNDLVEKYDNKRIILWLNEEKDSMWITNFTLWLVFSILPDMPDILAGGTIIGIMWAIGMLGTGGAILGGLAYIGGMLGGIPGIAPAIMGIVYIGIMFSILQKLFGLLF